MMKNPAAGRPVEELTSLSRVYLPAAYTRAASPVLQSYSSVLSGQVIAQPDDPQGAPVFASVSGVYTEQKEVSHPIYGKMTCLVMDCMDIRRPAVGERVDVTALTPEQIVDIARQQAVIDELDGRYVYEKLQEWAAEDCDVLVGDAVENQPYASAAWVVLNESVEAVYEGLTLAARAVSAAQYHLAVQPLPADHRRALYQRLGDEKRLFIVRGNYPARAYTEKAAGKTVRRLGVQALLALYRAAAFHEPHTTGVVTVAGEAVSTPRNVRVPFGTPATALFQLCGLAADPTLLLFGDRMTGVAIEDHELPILPGVTCLLALTDPPRPAPDVCVGCGWCVDVCHKGLMPEAIVRRQENGQQAYVLALHPELCDNCGACAAVCPSGRDLSVTITAIKQTILGGDLS